MVPESANTSGATIENAINKANEGVLNLFKPTFWAVNGSEKCLDTFHNLSGVSGLLDDDLC